MKMISIDFEKDTLTAVEKAGLLNVKKDGSLTRPAAAICSVIELVKTGSNKIDAVILDEYCFEKTGFTLSGNKTKGTSKNSSGTGKLYTRLDDYLNRSSDLFKYNRFTDTISFTEKGKALFLSQKREKVQLKREIPVGKNLKLTPVKFKGRKAILTKADLKKISSQLINHIQ